MNTEELIKTAEMLGLEYFNVCKKYISVKGVAGRSTLMQTDSTDESGTPATMSDFVEHIKEMGKEELKHQVWELIGKKI